MKNSSYGSFIIYFLKWSFVVILCCHINNLKLSSGESDGNSETVKGCRPLTNLQSWGKSSTFVWPTINKTVRWRHQIMINIFSSTINQWFLIFIIWLPFRILWIFIFSQILWFEAVVTFRFKSICDIELSFSLVISTIGMAIIAARVAVEVIVELWNIIT